MKVEAIKGWSDLISAWVTTLGLIGGGCFGLVEYASKNRSEEIKTALTFLDRYDQAPYLEAHEHVFDVWYSTAFIDRLQVEAGKGSNGDVRAFLLRSVEEGKLEADINRLIEFYDGLSACTCGGACDADTVMRLFRQHAADLNGNAFPYIAEQRKRSRDRLIGSGLHSIAISHNEKELKAACPKK